MSRFDFDDNGDPRITWEMMAWNLRRHIATAKGQAKLREFRDALLAMPARRLISSDLATKDGDVCAIGAFAAYRRMQNGKDWHGAVEAVRELYQPTTIWGWDAEADAFTTQDAGVRECGLNRTLAWTLGYMNDEDFGGLLPEQRWQRMYAWVCGRLSEPMGVAA